VGLAGLSPENINKADITYNNTRNSDKVPFPLSYQYQPELGGMMIHSNTSHPESLNRVSTILNGLIAPNQPNPDLQFLAAVISVRENEEKEETQAA
jgi:hypothetical protein